MSGRCQGILEFQMKFRFSKKKKEEKYWKWLGQFSVLFGSCWTILTASKFFCLKENWRVWRTLSPQLPFVLRWWNVFVKHKIFPDYRNQSYCLIVNNNLGKNMFCRSFSSGKFEFVSGKCQGNVREFCFFPSVWTLSVMRVISWKKKPIFSELILLFKRQNTIPYGQKHYQCFWPYGILFCHKSDNGW